MMSASAEPGDRSAKKSSEQAAQLHVFGQFFMGREEQGCHPTGEEVSAPLRNRKSRPNMPNGSECKA